MMSATRHKTRFIKIAGTMIQLPDRTSYWHAQYATVAHCPACTRIRRAGARVGVAA